ncbi:SND2/TMEM208 family protein [Aspergillus chevalieri]|uniref:DUF788 domain protein n=1 Tax=Aspergillus chevalieri TaxID=182096 RepID=A0A7R7ZNT1_ASPCH|nr:uncharacterized protein ACHE_50393S [Aspergillus chevalieri]BCR89195.1 hypothetical protein ACHE_50393S [Aspergillus chevalieri]
MAQKAAKSLAVRNTSTLNRTHLIALALHTIYLLLHFTFNRPRSLKPYFLLAGPTLLIEFYLERLGRPRYTDDGNLRTPGEDLGATGLTEYMWDVVYWTWGCMVSVCLFNDRAWWLWVVVPLYSVWLAYTTFTGMRSGFAGMGAGSEQAAAAAGGESKRQKKLEKRGGQKVQYR